MDEVVITDRINDDHGTSYEGPISSFTINFLNDFNQFTSLDMQGAVDSLKSRVLTCLANETIFHYSIYPKKSRQVIFSASNPVLYYCAIYVQTLPTIFKFHYFS